MKEPKTFNRPRAYIRIDGVKKVHSAEQFRIRIIYPDGKAEWSKGNYYSNTPWSTLYPCWHKNISLEGKPKMTATQAVEAMKEYDKAEGYKTLYLGEF